MDISDITLQAFLTRACILQPLLMYLLHRLHKRSPNIILRPPQIQVLIPPSIVLGPLSMLLPITSLLQIKVADGLHLRIVVGTGEKGIQIMGFGIDLSRLWRLQEDPSPYETLLLLQTLRLKGI